MGHWKKYLMSAVLAVVSVAAVKKLAPGVAAKLGL